MELDLSLGGDVLASRKNKPATQKADFFGIYFLKDDNDGGTSEDDGAGEGPLQLSLLPLGPPNSCENGSSENESSGNRPPQEDALSGNSVGSSLQMDFGLLKPTGNENAQVGSGGGAAAERGSDDEDNAVNTRKKLRLSKEQSAFLEDSFKEHSTLNPKQKMALAKQLNLRPRQVEVWFQNRRARTKLKQTEVDCEYLKRCCDALTEENRRLQKEVRELKALKSAAPFYMQVPATTLTMCPSCERVTGSAAPPGDGKLSSSTTRPRFFPFQQPPSHPHQPAAS